MIELTCPAEEGIEAAAMRKETRYQELQVAAKAWGNANILRQKLVLED